MDKPTPAHEAMPSSRDWGKYGWTYQTLEDAQLRFKSQLESRLEGAAFVEGKSVGAFYAITDCAVMLSVIQVCRKTHSNRA
jgi:hypothetical protein